MSGETHRQAVAARLRQAREARFPTAKAFAEHMGVPQPTYAQHENAKHSLREDVAQKYADALGVGVQWLLFGHGSVGAPVAVIGAVEAGHWSEAYEWPEQDREGFYAPPTAKYGSRPRFGLRVVGTSMNRIYPDGAILDCVSIEEGDIVEGRRVIAERVDRDGLVEATVKELARGLDGQWLLYPRSLDPAHQSPVAWDPDATDTVRIVALVIGAYISEEAND